MLEDPVTAGWVLAAIAAALIVVGAWLTFPRGREPQLGRVALVFGVAFIATPIAILPLLPLATLSAMLPPVMKAFTEAIFLAALPEEAWKALVVWLLVLRQRKVRAIQDGAFYGIAAGMGFALVENLLYVAGAEAQGASADQVAFVRVVSAGPLHAAASAMLVHRLFIAAVAPRAARTGHVLRGFAAAIALHGGYDLCLMLAVATGNPLVALGAPVILFIGLAAAANTLLRARALDDALRARRAAV